MKSSTDPNYCQRVTANDGALGEQYLRAFQDNEKTIPTILTTSQKLSTGVDARNVRNIVLMRPINSMIEFKQIIGRGTRLYEGKEYFTIYDFVNAHHHFQDPEWDGEPAEPEESVSVVDYGTESKATVRVMRDPPDTVEYGRREKIRINLADGKERMIQHMAVTSFWHPDGTPMSAVQFMELLFGKMPEFFKSEEELRGLWCAPVSRARLLESLAERGFGQEQLSEMQRIIDAEACDLFDVLRYVAYALPTVSRQERAGHAREEIAQQFGVKQQGFLEFVLAQYVKVGVEELSPDKLSPLLKLRYNNAISDAVAELGKPEEIQRLFVGFQRYLYEERVA